MAEAKSTNLFDILSETEIFDIPIYQRSYTWSKEKCVIFFSDILEEFSNYEDGKNSGFRFGLNSWNKYYIGNIVVLDGSSSSNKIIVDGQQRITTTILFLSSLLAASKELETDTKYQSVIRIKGINTLKENEINFVKRFILNSQNQVKMKYTSMYKGEELNKLVTTSIPLNAESKYYENFVMMKEWIIDTAITKTHLLDNGSLMTFVMMLKHTVISNVIISKKENPTKIFEKINNTSSKLTVSDLIRNALFFETYQDYFQPFLNQLDNLYSEFEDNILEITRSRDKHVNTFGLNSFFRYFNIIVGATNRLANEDGEEVYSDFRKYLIPSRLGEIEYVKSMIEELIIHSKISNYILLFKPSNNKDDIFYNSIKRVMFSFYTIIHSYMFESFKHFNENGNKKIADYIREKAREDLLYIIKLCNELLYSMLFSGVQLKNITRGMSTLFIDYSRAQSQLPSLSFSEFLRNKNKYSMYEENLVVLNLDELKANAKTTKLGTSGKATSTSFLYLIDSYLGGFNKNYAELEKKYKRFGIIPKDAPTNSRFNPNPNNPLGFLDKLMIANDLIGNYTLYDGKLKNPMFNDFIDDKSSKISYTISKEFNVDDIAKRTENLIELYWKALHE